MLVGILEPDQTELSSSHDEMSNNLPDEMSYHPPGIKQCDCIDEYPDKSNVHVPQLFDPILKPTQESMPSDIDSNDTVYIEKNNNAIIKARQGHSSLHILEFSCSQNLSLLSDSDCLHPLCNP